MLRQEHKKYIRIHSFIHKTNLTSLHNPHFQHFPPNKKIFLKKKAYKQ